MLGHLQLLAQAAELLALGQRLPNHLQVSRSFFQHRAQPVLLAQHARGHQPQSPPDRLSSGGAIAGSGRMGLGLDVAQVGLQRFLFGGIERCGQPPQLLVDQRAVLRALQRLVEVAPGQRQRVVVEHRHGLRNLSDFGVALLDHRAREQIAR